MSLANEVPFPSFNRPLITIITPICSLIIISTCYLCYYVIKHYFNKNQNQTQDQEDIELGLSSPEQQLQMEMEVINMPENQEDKEALSFKKVSWTDKIGTISECVICFEEFVDGDECRVRSKCNHIFHKACISDWLTKHVTCPLCRGGVPGFVFRYVTTADHSTV